MAKKVFDLTANVSKENPRTIRGVIEGLVEKGLVTPTDDGFQVKAKIIG